MTDELLAARDFGVRAFAFEDVTIRSDGDGRTVEAYAAAFNVPAEIRDADGHYNEELARGSFTRTIGQRGTNFGVFYNHARTLHGTPDGALSVPIGVPLEVREDERGVFTATRYLDNALADSVLDGIKQKAIRGQSFSGRFIQSKRSRATRSGGLPTIMRNEVAMKEYGPTVFPAYAEAAILGTRSVKALLEELGTLDAEDLESFRQMLGIATPLDPANSTDDTSKEPVVVSGTTDPATGHSARHAKNSFSAQIRLKGVIS